MWKTPSEFHKVFAFLQVICPSYTPGFGLMTPALPRGSMLNKHQPPVCRVLCAALCGLKPEARPAVRTSAAGLALLTGRNFLEVSLMKKLLAMCWLLLACTAGLVAQIANNTSLVGTITDHSGSVIAGAHVKAVEQSTKVTLNATTNDQGYYAMTFIASGAYNVTVEQAGFKKITKTGVTVPINLAVRTDFTLDIGSEEVTVEVAGTTPPISTDDATLGETFASEQVESLPMMSHNALDVASMSSNVYIGSKSSYSGIPPGEDFQGAGQREIQNSLTLDGVSIMNNLISTAPARPSTDMIQQVQMQSGNYPAQYGSYLGIHINLASKQGSNKLHGGAYDYIENTAFNAKTFTQTAAQAKSILHWNQYGFFLGGPVVVPHLYNGRNHTFFFGSYEKLNNVGQASGIATVLTDAMKKGDFSAIGSWNSTTNTCVAPSGYTATPVCLQDPTKGTGNYFANNQVSSSLLSSSNGLIAQAYEKYMVPANVAGSANGTANNLNTSYPAAYFIRQTLDRVDENIGDNIKLFFRVHWQNLSIQSGTFFPSNASYGPTNTRNYAFGYTHVITPSLVNDFHAGMNTLISDNVNYWYQNGLKSAGSALGIPNFTADVTYGNPGVPIVSISGVQGVGNGGSNWFQDDRTYDLYDEISWTRGRHNIMAGAEFRRLALGREASNNPLGAFNFLAGQAGIYSTGDARADFVMGYANNNQTPIATVKGAVTQWRDGFFILDNWQATPKLTINYGFRYDLPTVPTSLNGYARVLNADETKLIPDSNCPSGSACTGALYKATPGFKFINAQHDNLGPRLGISYRATNRLVVRAGGGFYYNANQLNSYTLASGNYPFAATANYYSSASNVLTFTNNTPGSASTSPVAGVAGTYVSVFTDNASNKTQRAYQWNMDAGYQLWQGAAFDLQYLGSRSLHLDRSFYDNEPLTPAAGSVNSRRPNQLFGSIRKIQNDAYSTYHAMTAVLRQRNYHGLSGQVSYTWSHTLDLSPDSNGGGTFSQQYNPKADYGNANWDITHRIVGTLTYTIPSFAKDNLLVRTVLGGWEVAAVANGQSGTPFNVNLSYNSANMSQGTQRPSWVHTASADCGLKNYIAGNKSSCIDTSAYTLPANITAGQYAFGNTSRNTLHGPGLTYENLSLMKNFPIHDSMKFQFRAEAFNVFNHPSAANPSTSIGHDNSATALPDFSSFGRVTGTQSVAGTISGARVLSLVAKIVF